jgi:hypothetical protein
MHDGVDGIATQQLQNEVLVADIAFDEFRALRNGSAELGRVLSRTTTSSPASSSSSAM